MKSFIVALFFIIFIFPLKAEQQFMKVHPDLIITEDNQRCFLIKPGYSRRDTAQWVPYCGKFTNFFYEQGYEYTLRVDRYDPNARVIRVIKTVGRDNIDSYRKQLAMEKRKQLREAEEARRAQEQAQSETNSESSATESQIQDNNYYDDGFEYDYIYDDGFEYDYFYD